MKNLVFGALLLGGLSQASGCIITTSDDDSDILVTWELVDTGGNELFCDEMDYDRVTVIARAPDGVEFEAQFDCGLGSGRFDVPPDFYVLTVRLEGADVIVVDDLEVDVPVDGTGARDIVFEFEVGRFSLDWEIVDSGGGPLTCGDVGAYYVSVLSTVSGAGPDVPFYETLFPCEDGVGLTSPLPADSYVVSVSILDENKESFGSDETEISIMPGKVTDLGTYTFEFSSLTRNASVTRLEQMASEPASSERAPLHH